MIHIVDDAYLEGLTALGCCGSGSGRSGGRCSTVLEAEPPQPVNASAETAEAAIAALRKLRREIMVTFS